MTATETGEGVLVEDEMLVEPTDQRLASATARRPTVAHPSSVHACRPRRGGTMVTERTAPSTGPDVDVSVHPTSTGAALPEQAGRRAAAGATPSQAVPPSPAVPVGPGPERLTIDLTAPDAGDTGPAGTGSADTDLADSDPADSNPVDALGADGAALSGAGTRPRHRTADLAAELFRSWSAGDTSASHELVALVTPTLWHTARAYRLDAATAEDVVQNAWLALARRRGQIRDPQAVLAWLMVTVRRDAARSAAATRATVPDPGPVLELTADPAPGPARTALDADEARRLWAAVARLPERCRRLLRVVAFSDRPDYASLSKDLGMPVGSIGPTRGRCLKKLRDDLDGQGGWTA